MIRPWFPLVGKDRKTDVTRTGTLIEQNIGEALERLLERPTAAIELRATVGGSIPCSGHAQDIPVRLSAVPDS